MAFLRRKKVTPQPTPAAGSTAPLTVAFLVAMVVAVLVLKGVQLIGRTPASQPAPSTVEDFLDQLSPDPTEIENLLGRRLEYEAADVADLNILGRDGLPIQAIMAKPAGHGPFPGVVLVHDAPASRTDTDNVHGALAARLSESLNAVVVSVDWRDSIIGEEDFSDILSTLDWFKRGSELKDQPVLIVGFGQGAYLSLLAAQQYTANVVGVAAINPIVDLAALHKYLEEKTLGAGDKLLFNAGCRAAVSPEDCLSDGGVMSNVERLDEPVLLMHHADNVERPISQSEILASRLVSTQVEFVRVESEPPEAEEEEAGPAEEAGAANGVTGDLSEEPVEPVVETNTVDTTIYGSETEILQDPSSDSFSEAYDILVEWAEQVLADEKATSEEAEPEDKETGGAATTEAAEGANEDVTSDNSIGAQPIRIETE